jgi:hypothetical protein
MPLKCTATSSRKVFEGFSQGFRHLVGTVGSVRDQRILEGSLQIGA